jgi:hypothetical protein
LGDGYIERGQAGPHAARWSKKVIEQLSEWYHSEKMDIRWLTGWGLRANALFAPVVKLPQLENGFDAEFLEPNSRPNKIASFISFHHMQLEKEESKKNKIIWIDDEAIAYLDDVEKTLYNEKILANYLDDSDEKIKRLNRIENFKSNPKLLIIQPEPDVGLVPKHFHMINAFIENRLPEKEMFAYHRSLPSVGNACVIC